MSVVVTPGVAACPTLVAPQPGYTTPWRVDPATGKWWMTKVTRYATNGGGFVVPSPGNVAVAELDVPDQGVLGVLNVWGNLLLQGSNAGDVWDVELDATTPPSNGGNPVPMSRARAQIPATAGGYITTSLLGGVVMYPGFAMRLRLVVYIPQPVGGVVTTFEDYRFNEIVAIFVPT